MHDLHMNSGLILVQVLVQYTCNPVSASSIGGGRARPNEPTHLREKASTSRDSQGINSLLSEYFWRIYMESWHDRATRNQMFKYKYMSITPPSGAEF